MIGKLFEFLKSLVILAIFGGIAWYGYSMWQESSPPVNDAVPGASFNCRKALVDLATDYKCRDSSACTMTEHEMTKLKRLEINISIYCD